MVTTKTVEKQIRMREGFDVVISPRSRSLQSYLNLSQKASRRSWTVQEWKDKKSYPNYDGFVVSVLYGDGNNAPGMVLLRNVCESYHRHDST